MISCRPLVNVWLYRVQNLPEEKWCPRQHDRRGTTETYQNRKQEHLGNLWNFKVQQSTTMSLISNKVIQFAKNLNLQVESRDKTFEALTGLNFRRRCQYLALLLESSRSKIWMQAETVVSISLKSVFGAISLRHKILELLEQTIELNTLVDHDSLEKGLAGRSYMGIGTKQIQMTPVESFVLAM